MAKRLDKYTERIIELIAFKVGGVKYAVDIYNVQEINRVTEIFKTNNTPAYADGVMNQRGKVVPIINLRRIFEIKNIDDDFYSRIIMIDIGNVMHGMLVDSVINVIKLPIDAIYPLNQESLAKAKKYITGVADLENESVYILDAEKLIQ